MMIIERFRATVKRGRMDEAIAIVSQMPPAKRLGRTSTGDNDRLSFDFEYENMAAYADAMDDRFTAETQTANAAAGWWDVTLAVETELIKVID
jgi:hypothetical protein